MDTLNIANLNVMTHIGVYAWEQKILQPLWFDIQIPLEIEGCQDKLENTLNYETLCQRITAFVESTSFGLIETVAEAVAMLIKTEFNAKEVTLTIKKPHAIKNAEMISLTIKR